jgi:WD40 repeat protein
VIGLGIRLAWQRPKVAGLLRRVIPPTGPGIEQVSRFRHLRDQGDAALGEKQYDRAITAFRAARDLCPSGDPRRDEAAQMLERTVQARQGEFDACIKQGHEHALAHRYDQAEASYKRARSLFEDQFDSEQLKKAESGLAETRSRKARDGAFTSLVQAGGEALGKGKFEAALDSYAKAKSIFPDDPQIGSKISEAREARDRYCQEHLARADSALRNKEWDLAIQLLTRVKEAGGEVEKAGRLLTEARVSKAEELVQRAQQALSQGKHTLAVDLLKQALGLGWPKSQIDPLLDEAVYLDSVDQARAALERSAYQTALEQAERALSKRPSGSQALRLRIEAKTALEHGEVRRLHGHPARIVSLAFDADRDRLFAGFGDGVVQVWDLAVTPASVHSSIQGPAEGQSPIALVLARSGKRVARAMPSGDIEVLSFDSGKESLGRPLRLERARTLAFSPDGSVLAAGSSRGTVQVWSVEGSSRELFEITKLTSTRPVTALAFSHDRKLLAVGFESGNVFLFDARPGGSRRILDEKPAEQSFAVTSLDFAPDNISLVSARTSGFVSAWDVTSRRRGEHVRAHLAHANAVAFSPNGVNCASVSEDGRVYWVRHTDGKRENRVINPGLALHAVAISAVAFDPRSEYLATGDQEGVIKLWSTKERGDARQDAGVAAEPPGRPARNPVMPRFGGMQPRSEAAPDPTGGYQERMRLNEIRIRDWQARTAGKYGLIVVPTPRSRAGAQPRAPR